MKPPCRLLLSSLVFLGLTGPLSAQWLTQTNRLVAGWNSVYLYVDTSHATLEQLLAEDPNNPVTEIWYWRPPLPTAQFVDSPQAPVQGSSGWVQWTRTPGSVSALTQLPANGAFLVRLPLGAAPYAWRVKGRPVPPNPRWTLTGLNFVGFPAALHPAPSFESFLAPAPDLQQTGEFFRYVGGELGAANPARLPTLTMRSTPVVRQQAYWVRAGDSYNQYFGPLRIVQSGSSGLEFGDGEGQTQFLIRNDANTPVVVTMESVDSEPAPAGQPTVAGRPPLLLRGDLNTTNLTFSYRRLAPSARTQWTLAPSGQPGSEVAVTLGLDRSQLPGDPGAFFASVLRFTDSLGLSQIDLGVSAVKESTAGLWVGAAAVSYVSHYLKPYARVDSAAELESLLARLQLQQGANGYRYEWDPTSGRVLVFGGPDSRTGSYLLDGPIKVDSGTVAQPFPLRLILHSDGTRSRLLQKVYHGVSTSSNVVLATRESLLHPGLLASARRISAVHLPTSPANLPWEGAGSLRPGGTWTVSVPLAHDDQASNPFLHTYHPDHDNLDPLFADPLPAGVESYAVTRQFTLTFRAPGDDFNSLTGSSGDLGGDYAEVVTFAGRNNQTRRFNVLGRFTLKRISDIASLTTR